VSACAGVEALHACGILHRDVKPANIVRTGQGSVKLVDLGLSRRLNERRTAGTAGTPHYMSPEQCCGEIDDERTDIYSLGATYFSLLTGRTPYREAAGLAVMLDQCAAPVPDPRSSAAVPDACAEIVLRALAKRRVDRFASARAMGDALKAALARGAFRGCGRGANRPGVGGKSRETVECPTRNNRT
jgi:urea transport system substrate-binding protein